jgi:hypothetical protein
VEVPDLKLDFSRVTYSNVLEIIAPIVPGGILGVGTLVLNPSLAARLLSNPYLGYRSRLAAAIFVSYAAGLLLNLLVNYTSYLLGYMVGFLWGSKLFPNPATPWRNILWRKVARRFLGPDLAPTTDDLYFKELHEQKLKEAGAIQDAQQSAIQVQLAQEYFLSRSMADNDWYWWNQVLGKYFATPQLWAAPRAVFSLHGAHRILGRNSLDGLEPSQSLVRMGPLYYWRILWQRLVLVFWRSERSLRSRSDGYAIANLETSLRTRHKERLRVHGLMQRGWRPVPHTSRLPVGL